MGSVGKSISIPQTNLISQEPKVSKVSNKSQALVDYFSERTLGKLDIKPYLQPKYDKKGYTTVDYALMPRLVQQQFNQIVQEGRIESTDYGAWGKWIKLKSR